MRQTNPAPLGADAMLADYLILATTSTTATLLSWNGTAWVVEHQLTSDEYRFTTALQSGRTDFSLPFNALGIGTPTTNLLGLLAFASEDTAFGQPA